MRDFTTPDYIRPVICEIFTDYEPENTHPATLKALDCIAILKQKNGRGCIAIRTPDKGAFNYYCHPAINNLLKAVSDFAETVETHPGQLHEWEYQEERRIMEAIRKGIIEKIQKGEKTA